MVVLWPTWRGLVLRPIPIGSTMANMMASVLHPLPPVGPRRGIYVQMVASRVNEYWYEYLRNSINHAPCLTWDLLVRYSHPPFTLCSMLWLQWGRGLWTAVKQVYEPARTTSQIDTDPGTLEKVFSTGSLKFKRTSSKLTKIAALHKVSYHGCLAWCK